MYKLSQAGYWNAWVYFVYISMCSGCVNNVLIMNYHCIPSYVIISHWQLYTPLLFQVEVEWWNQVIVSNTKWRIFIATIIKVYSAHTITRFNYLCTQYDTPHMGFGMWLLHRYCKYWILWLQLQQFFDSERMNVSQRERNISLCHFE